MQLTKRLQCSTWAKYNYKLRGHKTWLSSCSSNGISSQTRRIYRTCQI